MKIDQAHLNKLRQYLSERDNLALALGRASIDRILNRAKLLASGISNLELYSQIGMQQVEFENLEHMTVEKIKQSNKRSEEIGTHALRSLGFDIDHRTMSINLETGEATELCDGKWRVAE